MNVFDPSELERLYKPHPNSSGEDNGQVTIIGGSKLFHGAPLLSLKMASRIVDMVFFASPEPSVGGVAERIRSELFSFIWVPWREVEAYIEKSDAVLIGPGLMRFTSESQNPNDKIQMTNDEEGRKTKDITKSLLIKFPAKKWVIDAGSLQTMDAEWIPEGAILTPNIKEFKILFGSKQPVASSKQNESQATNYMLQATSSMSKKYNCTIVLKGPETVVCSPDECVVVRGGNPGLTKGGTGDVLAGLTVALLAKNDPFLAATSASYIAKAAADELYKEVGVNYNADDLADKIPVTYRSLTFRPRVFTARMET